MRILVTGGLGFLGGRVAQHLVHKGHDVLIGTHRDIDGVHNLNECTQVVQTCWNDVGKLERICSEVDVIIHASGMNAQDCAVDPVGALNINAVATASILQAAIKMKVKRFLYVSTVHVYTDYLHGEISELYCPSNLHPYATSNRAAENVVFYAQKKNLIDGIVIRLSNGYGVPVHRSVNCWKLLVNDLCRQSAENQEIRLVSNGMQSRNFIAMNEICNVIDLLSCCTSLSKNVGEIGPINVGGKTSLTVLEMAKIVQNRCSSVLGFTPELIIGHQGNMNTTSHFDYKIDRLQKIGYVHVHDPTEEMDNLIKYCHIEFNKGTMKSYEQ